MRKLAVLLAAFLWAAAVRADGPTAWFDDPTDQSDTDKSMTVYPAALARQSRPVSYHGFQATDEEEMLPVPGVEIPQPDLEDKISPLAEPPPSPGIETTREKQTAPDKTTPPAPLPPTPSEKSTLRRSAPEEVPPSADWIDDGDGSTMAPVDMAVTPWGGEAPAAVWSSGEWFRSGIWYTNADFMVVRRSRPRDQLLIGIDITNPDNLFFNYGASAGVEPGMRVTIGRFIGRDWENRDHSFEVTFLGVNEYSTGQGIRSQTEQGLILLLDQKQGGVNGADVWTTMYDSRFHSVEADLRLRHRPDKDRLVMAPDGTWTRQYTSSYVPSLILGLRYIKLDEEYSFRSRSQVADISEAFFRGDYDIETNNDLAGVQIGGDFINQRERWYWGVRGKLGAFVNFAEQYTVAQFNDLRAPGPGNPGDPSLDIAPREEQASKANEALFGEIGIMAAYHFNPNFSARAGYDFMWLAGVALAPDQFTFTETARLAVDGVIFYQGLSLGLEVVW
jgi:hypothetical protein